MIKQIIGLCIGELAAATSVNDHGVTYISMGPVSDSEGEEILGIDEIEARALHEWLGRALPPLERRRPTIAELEAILAQPESDLRVTVNPDGSISATDTSASKEPT